MRRPRPSDPVEHFDQDEHEHKTRSKNREGSQVVHQHFSVQATRGKGSRTPRATSVTVCATGRALAPLGSERRRRSRPPRAVRIVSRRVRALRRPRTAVPTLAHANRSVADGHRRGRSGLDVSSRRLSIPSTTVRPLDQRRAKDLLAASKRTLKAPRGPEGSPLAFSIPRQD